MERQKIPYEVKKSGKKIISNFQNNSLATIKIFLNRVKKIHYQCYKMLSNSKNMAWRPQKIVSNIKTFCVQKLNKLQENVSNFALERLLKISYFKFRPS